MKGHTLDAPPALPLDTACRLLDLAVAREGDGDRQYQGQQPQHAELDHGVAEGGHHAPRHAGLRLPVRTFSATTRIRRIVAIIRRPGKARSPARAIGSTPARRAVSPPA